MARRKSFSFLERNQRIIGAIGILLIIAGTAFALLLQGGFFASTYRVHAAFSDAAGIQAGDYVTVAGLQAGAVGDVRIDDGLAVMELNVSTDVTLPADTRAEIVIETLLGRRSVSLVAGAPGGRLGDGAIIPLERTTTPVDITELNDISVRLLEASDAEAFEQLMQELTAVTEGEADEVKQLITGLDDVLAAVDRRRTELAGLIDSLRILGTTFAHRDDRIVSLIDNLDVVLGNLADRQEELQALLVNTDVGAHETADLVRRNRQTLDQALAYLHTDLKVINRHQVDLAAAIAYLNQAVEGYSSVGYSQGTPNRWANIFVQQLGPTGVDALIGECGAVDQFFDHYFGTDCDDPPGPRTAPPAAEAGGEAPGQGPPGQGAIEGLVPAEVPALPCTVDDLVSSALEGTGVESSGGCGP